MRTIVIDGGKMPTRKEAHAYLAERLMFPEYYGANLDALSDCLSEIREETNIVIYRYAKMEEALGSYAESIMKVITHAAEENQSLIVLLDWNA